MTDAQERPTAPPPSLAATQAIDPQRLALAATHGSTDSRSAEPAGEDRFSPPLALLETSLGGSEDDRSSDLATMRTGAVAIGTLDTLDSGPRGRLARPDLDDPEERRRRQALKSRLFGEAEDAAMLGRYRVLGRLGAGGMGIVYTAYDERLDRKVAIKALRHDSGHSRLRLQREAQAMARLTHPNIVGVYEVFEEGASIYVAMEFVRGSSLDRWLEQPRTWREVLAVFLDAGRGLQAAHEAGLIHRDFKPANVIRGEDGRVKVLDFGLARAGAEAPEVEGAGALMRLDLTQTGAMMGTPAYMSPEQFSGEELTAASDQFSFFVALYEALFQVHPFAGDSVGALALSVTGGRPSDPPVGAAVPPWIRTAVMRGLARAPADRFPSMTAALAALADDPPRRRRRIAALCGLVLVSGGVSAATVAATRGDGCDDGAAATAGIWNEERMTAAQAAFSASAGTLGAETWTLIQPRIAEWVARWGELRGERCATYAAGQLSDSLHDRSVACLERQLARVDALVTAFVVADATVVEQAPLAVASLPTLALCSDTEYLLAEVSPPEDPQARAAVASGRAALERARAAIDLGDHDGALRGASEVAEQGRALDHAPLTAAAEVVRGDALQWKQDVAGAEQALSAALELGLASGDDHVAVEALARRLYVRAEFAGQVARALDDAALDRALLRRVDNDLRLRWLVTNNIAVAEERGGALDLAVRGYTEAMGLAGQLGAGASLESVVSQYNLGLARAQLGALGEAAEAMGSAAATAERLYGPHHPALVPILEGLAATLQAQGRTREARAVCERARTVASGRSDGSPALLLTIVELEAQIASLRRETTARGLADDAATRAQAAFGADSLRVQYARLRPNLYRPERDLADDAAVEALKPRGPMMWADAVIHRADALLGAGLADRAFALLRDARSAGDWAQLSVRTRVAIGLKMVDASIAVGRGSEAAAVLDEIEAMRASDVTPAVRWRIDLHRGRIAQAAGDPPAAVQYLRRAADGYALSFDADHPERLAVQAALAQALRANGEEAKADALGMELIAAYRGLGPGFAAEVQALQSAQTGG